MSDFPPFILSLAPLIISCLFHFPVVYAEYNPESVFLLMDCCIASMGKFSCSSVWEMKQETSDGLKTRTVNTVNTSKAESVSHSSWGLGEGREGKAQLGEPANRTGQKAPGSFYKGRRAAWENETPRMREKNALLVMVFQHCLAQCFSAHVNCLATSVLAVLMSIFNIAFLSAYLESWILKF